LEEQVYLDIFLDFKLWIYADAELQREVVKVMNEHIQKNQPWFHTVVGVQRVLDICRSYYWFQPEEHSLAVEPTMVDKETGLEHGRRPSIKEVKELRRALLEIVYTFTKDTITFDEAKSIILYIADCPDHKQVVDLLQVKNSSL
jgi:hypothetical protein